MKTTKIVIIGAGIAGITCAIYLKRANKDFVLLDGNMPGGKLVNLHKIENYPGYSSISGPELALSLAKQLKDNDINLEYDEEEFEEMSKCDWCEDNDFTTLYELI